ncbi:MAG: orotate phosphoribosyltransferase [Acidiferrobacteraceae bacterium]
MDDGKRRFFDLAIESGVLQFGEFVLKSGRRSPYFFNAGLFASGRRIAALGECYADQAIGSKLAFDVVFGPAYKGIALATATAMSLARRGQDVGYAFNRKETKDHGEGGVVIGHALAGRRVLVVDDVISSGISVDGAVELIRAQGATPVAIVIALDRCERGTGSLSAVDEVRSRHGLPVLCVATILDLLVYLRERGGVREHVDAIEAYLERYGSEASRP